MNIDQIREQYNKAMLIVLQESNSADNTRNRSWSAVGLQVCRVNGIRLEVSSYFEKSILIQVPYEHSFNKLSKWLSHNYLESDSYDRGQQIVQTGADQLRSKALSSKTKNNEKLTKTYCITN